MTKVNQTQEKKSEKIKIDKNLISDAFKKRVTIDRYRWFLLPWFRCLGSDALVPMPLKRE
jgi:hypothetical protein